MSWGGVASRCSLWWSCQAWRILWSCSAVGEVCNCLYISGNTSVLLMIVSHRFLTRFSYLERAADRFQAQDFNHCLCLLPSEDSNCFSFRTSALSSDYRPMTITILIATGAWNVCGSIFVWGFLINHSADISYRLVSPPYSARIDQDTVSKSRQSLSGLIYKAKLSRMLFIDLTRYIAADVFMRPSPWYDAIEGIWKEIPMVNIVWISPVNLTIQLSKPQAAIKEQSG